MKTTMIILILVFNASLPAQVMVTAVKGEVAVRHGVATEWLPVLVGDVLKPDDSMRTGERASATVVVDGKKRIVVPENMVLDIGDFRELSRDELMLKLAMERVRALPDGGNQDRLILPQTSIVHGEKKGLNDHSEASGKKRQLGLLQLNGTHVLFRNGYYGTCALKAKEVFRLYPEYSDQIDARLMVATALEKVELYGEALTEYHAIAGEKLSRKDQALVREKIEQLKGRSRKSEADDQ